MIDGAFPADLELALVETDPFSYQANRPSRDFSIEDGAVKCYTRGLPRITSMKVGWVVVAEEHQNRDPVEGADPGHIVNISVLSDRLTEGTPEADQRRESGLAPVPFRGRTAQD
jgi:hypothetical protein